MLVYDAKAIARLDKLYSSPQVVEQRKRLRAIVSARRGEIGLDVGCGVAFLACELAREVAPEGRIAGIDLSTEAIEASRARIAKEELDQFVDVRVGPATDLPFPDGAFDFVVAAQVYCYVPDVSRAIREAARVLRKGGRLIVLDSDWDMCIWASEDPSLSRRMVAARGAMQFAHAHLPRQLHGLILNTGLSLMDTQSFAILETRYDADSFSVGIIPHTREAALRHGISTEEVSRWEADLRGRKAEGEWFFCLNRFVFTALKQ